jgi:thiol:disulfide interchange protein DsbD
MGRRSSFRAAVLVLLFSAASVSASDWGEGNARARLVTSVASPEAGGTFLLGVRFDIRPGWHIYWRNPGGAGLSTDITWRIPDGFGAAPILWPTPIHFTQSGDIPGYGYIESVILASEISVPQDFGEKTPATVGARVSWLACKDVCVIGEAVLEGSLAKLPVDPDFASWTADLPRPSGDPRRPFNLTSRGGLADGKIELWLQWRQAPRRVEWFPDPSDSLEVGDVEARTRGSLTRIDATLRKLAGKTEKSNSLSSLVVMTDENGRRHGWELVVDLSK